MSYILEIKCMENKMVKDLKVCYNMVINICYFKSLHCLINITAGHMNFSNKKYVSWIDPVWIGECNTDRLIAWWSSFVLKYNDILTQRKMLSFTLWRYGVLQSISCILMCIPETAFRMNSNNTHLIVTSCYNCISLYAQIQGLLLYLGRDPWQS